MYILKLKDCLHPFAVVNYRNDNLFNRIEKAIEEETLLTDITIESSFKLPDWGGVDYFEISGKNDENFQENHVIEVQKLVLY